MNPKILSNLRMPIEKDKYLIQGKDWQICSISLWQKMITGGDLKNLDVIQVGDFLSRSALTVWKGMLPAWLLWEWDPANKNRACSPTQEEKAHVRYSFHLMRSIMWQSFEVQFILFLLQTVHWGGKYAAKGLKNVTLQRRAWQRFPVEHLKLEQWIKGGTGYQRL